MVDTSDDWIMSRTGIRERRICDPSQGTSHLAADAATRALKHAGVAAGDVDLLIVGTTTPDTLIPSCSCLVQRDIGAQHAVCFDLAAACAGFVFALETANQFLLSGTYRTALVIGAEKISSYIDWKDRTTCVLFGDAAGACVMRKVDGRGLISSHLASDGNHADLIEVPAGGSRLPPSPETIAQRGHYLKMKGSEVFKHAVKAMTSSIEAVLQKSGLTAQDIACIIPHQANMRIIDAIVSRLEVDPSKVFVNLEKYGNTSAASIVLALSEAYNQGKLKKGDLVLMTTFGSGFVWGSAILEWSL